MVIGSRALPGSQHRGPPALVPREHGPRSSTSACALLAVPGLHDTQCGFKLFTRRGRAETAFAPRAPGRLLLRRGGPLPRAPARATASPRSPSPGATTRPRASARCRRLRWPSRTSCGSGSTTGAGRYDARPRRVVADLGRPPAAPSPRPRCGGPAPRDEPGAQRGRGLLERRRVGRAPRSSSQAARTASSLDAHLGPEAELHVLQDRGLPAGQPAQLAPRRPRRPRARARAGSRKARSSSSAVSAAWGRRAASRYMSRSSMRASRAAASAVRRAAAPGAAPRRAARGAPSTTARMRSTTWPCAARAARRAGRPGRRPRSPRTHGRS